MQELEGNSISGYEGLDAREVEEARIRSQRPSEYVVLPRADNLEDLYSRPIKKNWRSLVYSQEHNCKASLDVEMNWKRYGSTKVG